MRNVVIRSIFGFFLLISILGFNSSGKVVDQSAAGDMILGDWITAEKMLKVRVFKENGEYKAIVLWFYDEHYKCKLKDCTDENNPDPALRTRKLLGMEVLTGLVYSPSRNMWVNGKVYDSNSGNTYESIATMPNKNKLYARGYYLFEWLGRNMEFDRLPSN